MRMTHRRLCASWLCLVAAACQPDVDLEGERAALFHADESWAAAAEAGDMERMFTFWTEDAVIYPPVGPAIEGLDAIRAFVREARNQPGFSLTWTPTGAEVAGKADVGYTTGSWRSTVDGTDGAPITRTGSYLSIWRKQANGTWKCSVEISQLGRLPNHGGPPNRGEPPAR